MRATLVYISILYTVDMAWQRLVGSLNCQTVYCGYGVASISELLELSGLFCEGALAKKKIAL